MARNVANRLSLHLGNQNSIGISVTTLLGPYLIQRVNKGVWKGPDWVKFYNIGSERGYHYLGSARIYYRMGKAFGEGMVELLK